MFVSQTTDSESTQIDNRLRRISSGGLDSVVFRRIFCELEFSSWATFNFPLEGNYLLATSGGYTKQNLARIYDPFEEVAAQRWREEKVYSCFLFVFNPPGPRLLRSKNSTSPRAHFESRRISRGRTTFLDFFFRNV